MCRDEFTLSELLFPLRFAGNHAARRASAPDFVQLVPVKNDIRPQKRRVCPARRTRYVPFLLRAVFKFNGNSGRFLVGRCTHAHFFLVPKGRKPFPCQQQGVALIASRGRVSVDFVRKQNPNRAGGEGGRRICANHRHMTAWENFLQDRVSAVPALVVHLVP